MDILAEEVDGGYLFRFEHSAVGSPERAALVADLRAALPGVLDALGMEA